MKKSFTVSGLTMHLPKTFLVSVQKASWETLLYPTKQPYMHITDNNKTKTKDAVKPSSLIKFQSNEFIKMLKLRTADIFISITDFNISMQQVILRKSFIGQYVSQAEITVTI